MQADRQVRARSPGSRAALPDPVLHVPGALAIALLHRVEVAAATSRAAGRGGRHRDHLALQTAGPAGAGHVPHRGGRQSARGDLPGCASPHISLESPQKVILNPMSQNTRPASWSPPVSRKLAEGYGSETPVPTIRHHFTFVPTPPTTPMSSSVASHETQKSSSPTDYGQSTN